MVQLANARPCSKYGRAVEREVVGLRIDDGAIKNITWEFERLPIVPTLWEVGLLVEKLTFLGNWWPPMSSSFRPNLPCLKALSYDMPGLKSLDLSLVPNLTELRCSGDAYLFYEVDGYTNDSLQSYVGYQLDLVGDSIEDNYDQLLVSLDLSPVRDLIELDCRDNALKELNLIGTPFLRKLYCSNNSLTRLDLSPVPGLTELECDLNLLTELDLSPVPGLTSLTCDNGVRIYNAPGGLKRSGTIVSYVDDRPTPASTNSDFDRDGSF